METRIMRERQLTRRQVVRASAAGVAGLTLTGRQQSCGAPQPTHRPIKVFCCDLNWSKFDRPPRVTPSAPQDWAFIDPQAYFDWHRAFGNNAMFCQAYPFGGYAFYPSRLGPVAPGPGRELLPRLFDLARAAGMPFWSYFCVSSDLVMSKARPQWTFNNDHLAPESPWTDLLCDRITEFLSAYPVDWLLFDWFVYRDLRPARSRVRPDWYVEQPFREIIGRPMPNDASQITPAEHLKYKREILARQFRRLRDTVRQASPATKIIFNVPYHEPREALWVDHPMVQESDGLFAESSRDDIVEWLLAVRKPGQRVMTTIVGRVQPGDANKLDRNESDPRSWQKWYRRGCDFFGYAWGTPPDFHPHASYDEALKTVRKAFAAM